MHTPVRNNIYGGTCLSGFQKNKNKTPDRSTNINIQSVYSPFTKLIFQLYIVFFLQIESVYYYCPLLNEKVL